MVFKIFFYQIQINFTNQITTLTWDPKSSDRWELNNEAPLHRSSPIPRVIAATVLHSPASLNFPGSTRLVLPTIAIKMRFPQKRILQNVHVQYYYFNCYYLFMFFICFQSLQLNYKNKRSLLSVFVFQQFGYHRVQNILYTKRGVSLIT